jgi:hypothetical protein
MPGLWEFEMELSRDETIAAAERKLARPLTEPELAGIQKLSSLLRLKNCARLFTAEDFSPVQVAADLANLAKEANQK